MPRRKGQTPEHVKQERATNWKNFKRRERLAAAPQGMSDAELIAKALAEGRVTQCPPGFAYGALRWIAGGSKNGGDPA